jgi:uncharacterized protein (DUF2236 family)
MDSDDVRRNLAAMLLQRVAGADSDETHRKIYESPGERWFGPDRPIRRVHGDASMFIGGLRALLLQALHPLAMAGVAGHSGYRGDPWGRLQRTSYFVAVTTFGTIDDARAAIERVRSVHSRVTGTTADGRAYSANDPHLLRWVHIAEIDSFLRSHQQYGAHPLDSAGRDAYVADTAVVAGELGILDPPRTEAELATQLRVYDAELEGTEDARSTARFLLFNPPVPVVALAPYAALASAAIELLHPEKRRLLGLVSRLPLGGGEMVKASGEFVTSTIRWALSAPPLPKADEASASGTPAERQ